MLIATNISKTFGEKTVLNNVSFSLMPGDVVALIGDNGTGKTTLFRILNGDLTSDGGNVTFADKTIGYVPQQFIDFGETVGEVFGNAPEWQIVMALDKVGLVKVLDTKIATLSGGEKTRLSLARALACGSPSILILDEPTNNLDGDSREWLINFLQKFIGIVVFASHDRYFIDKVANRTFELENGKITIYGGNYSFYKQQKEVERQTAETRYEKFQTKKKQLEQLILHERHRAKFGLRDRRMKDNDKSLRDWKGEQVQRSAAGQLKARQTQLAKLDKPDRPEHQIQRSYRLIGEKCGLIIKVDSVNKSFGGQKILKDVSFDMHGNERVHLRGPNGSGKTTLIQIILGNIKADSGNITFSDHIKIGSLSQELADLDENKSAITQLEAMGYNTTEIYGALRSLELEVEEIKRPLKQLSRGQKTKVALAWLLLGKFNLIVLDEPTNHLEIKTREAIERALTSFDGAILFASHDRYFVQSLKPNKSVKI